MAKSNGATATATRGAHEGQTVLADKDRVVEILHALLPTMNDLYLQVRQAHWNVVGPRFRSVHLQLEEIYKDIAEQTDEVAERIRQFGDPVDGSAATIQKQTKLDAIEQGKLKDDDAVRLIAQRIATSVKEMRGHLEELDDEDPPTQDMINGIIAALEKHHWMLAAQLER